jgi:hypothetical protein
MVVVGLASVSREVEAPRRGVDAQPPVANLLSGPKMENRREVAAVAALVGTGRLRPCSLVYG